MQKKLIALAVAGLISAPAFAQSNVTVYGVADLTFENVRAKDATDLLPTSVSGNEFEAANNNRLSRNRLQSNSSLIGFKGVEDLGNGLKALFQFETTVGVDGENRSTANTGLFSTQRDTFIALQGGWGTVIGGFITHPIRAMGAKADLNPGATGIGFLGAIYETVQLPNESFTNGDDAAPVVQIAPGPAVRTGTGDRQELVAYVTPSFAGLTGTIAYLPGEDRRVSVANVRPELKPEGWQLAVQYENGPIYAGLGYHRVNDAAVVTGLGFDQENRFTDLRAVGKYTLGTGTTIAALWDRQKVRVDDFRFGPNPQDVDDGGDLRRDAWALSVGQTFGAHTIHLGYARSNQPKGSFCSDGDPTDGDITSCNNARSRMWTVGYEYALSKRTMLKAVYADIRNNANANVDFYTASVAGNTTIGTTSTLASGADPRGLGIGLRHSF